jgi:hypothetical protein
MRGRPVKRVAALYDVEGRLPALEAVLEDVERERPDAIVVGGDMVTGPMRSETLDRLRGLERAHFLRGNADRGVVEVKRGGRPEGLNDEVVEALAWTGDQLGAEQVNAGSVGMPWDDGPDPRWALLGPDIWLRRSELDQERPAEAIRASGRPGAEELLGDTRARDEVLDLFEQATQRGR